VTNLLPTGYPSHMTASDGSFTDWAFTKYRRGVLGWYLIQELAWMASPAPVSPHLRLAWKRALAVSPGPTIKAYNESRGRAVDVEEIMDTLKRSKTLADTAPSN
jgi:hypothetical protein